MRRIIYLLLVSCFLSTGSWAQHASHTVIISNIEQKKGEIYIAWYNNDTIFMDEEKVTFKKVVPVDGKKEISVSFDDIQPGTYAIAIFIDENGNGKLDRNFMGIPRERYAFSNNIYPGTRPATFQEASFQTGGKPATINIKMK